jgi:AcrR family transcriptional regulator
VDDTRQRLVNEAGQIFARKGFNAASVREICAAAGANVAAVHYHFGDKQRLYVEVLRQATCQEEPPEFGWTEGTSAEERLRDFLRHLLASMIDPERPEWQIELILLEMARPSEATQEVVESYIRPMFTVLEEIVRRLLPADATPTQRHLSVFSIISQCLLYRYHRPVGRQLLGEETFRSIFDLDLLTDHVYRFSLAGLRAFSESPAPAAPVERQS